MSFFIKSQAMVIKNFILVLMTNLFLLLSTSVSANKSVYGYLEPVTLTPQNVTLTAKLDTGAETASLSAKHIQLYHKAGEAYVKFTVSHPQITETLRYDLPVIHYAQIKKRAYERTLIKTHHARPVVQMRIYFDGQLHNIRVNLIDRSHFSTPMLLGRRALEKIGAIVDSTTKNTLLTENISY